ncbi:uncharacterized protein RSE6_06924 [Rhynchosporium secalis]|uniref:Uncharacterized protein n=1 Tax=Rhynchosporium secalis TaxID=38038 RepID=A0A1E1MBK8_RHYSE|nr:uncharacterized protein RSE6_06924 [Rhynchosporium secalis]
MRILKYARVTLETYSDVRRVSKEIWSGHRALFLPETQPGEAEDVLDIDLILHFGMVALGDDGVPADSAALKKLGLPATLSTWLDIETAWRGMKNKFSDATTLVSDDAGNSFCEFRLYSSLAESLLTESLREKAGHVAFQHVPQVQKIPN